MKTEQSATQIHAQQNAQKLAQAMDAELRLLRYWVLQTLGNYKAWRNGIVANDYVLPPKKHAEIENQVRKLVSKSMIEYRRKQSLLQNLIAKQDYFTDREIHFYRIENHFGAAMAATFANDNNA